MAGKSGRKIRGEEKANERLTLLVTPTEFHALKAHAAHLRIPVSRVLRDVLEAKLPAIFKKSSK